MSLSWHCVSVPDGGDLSGMDVRGLRKNGLRDQFEDLGNDRPGVQARIPIRALYFVGVVDQAVSSVLDPVGFLADVGDA